MADFFNLLIKGITIWFRSRFTMDKRLSCAMHNDVVARITENLPNFRHYQIVWAKSRLNWDIPKN